MFKYSFKDINYDGRLILMNNSLEMDYGTLTVITGESGSGKSTLFGSMCFENEWAKKYELNNISIMDMSYKERCDFLYYHLSAVHQGTFLINEITIQEHIDMIVGLIGSNKNINYYIKKLGLDSLLDKFPMQLSGGEQTRVCFVLSLLKDVDIYIYDEPTSSLDDYYARIVIELLGELRNRKKIVLVFTHDPLLIQEANKHYCIKNKEIHLMSHDNQEITEIQSKQSSMERNYKFIQNTFKIAKKHRKLNKIIISLFVTLSISIVGFAYSFNNFVYDKQQEQLVNIESNELLVFKAGVHAVHEAGNDFTYGHEQRLTQEDKEKISKIDHVVKYEWRYDNIEPNYEYNEDLLKVPFDSVNNSSREYIITIQDGKDETKMNVYRHSEVTISTYLKDQKNKKDIKLDFNNDGIYISNELANIITQELSISNEDLQGKSIRLNLSVPIYNTYGRWQGVTDDNEQVFIDSVTVTHEEVTLPIAGILEGSSFGVTNYYSNSLYIERSVFEQMIEKHKVRESRKLYVIGDNYQKAFLNSCPEEYKKQINRVFEDVPWEPTALSVYVDGIENLSDVTSKLENMGFSVYSQFVDSQVIGTAIQSMRYAILQGAIILMIIVCLSTIVIDYNDQSNKRQMRKYFYQLGLSIDDVKNLNKGQYIKNIISQIVKSTVMMLIILIFMNSLTMTLTIPSIYTFLIIVLLSAFIHFVVPTFFERRG